MNPRAGLGDEVQCPQSALSENSAVTSSPWQENPRVFELSGRWSNSFISQSRQLKPREVK